MTAQAAFHPQAFIELALSRGVLKFGEFTLKSGRVSPYFFNAGLLNDGEALSLLASGYADKLTQCDNVEVVFGPAYKGIPFVAIIVTMFGAIPGLLSEQFAPETIFKNLLGVAAFTMVVVWMSICLIQFNFRRQWYKQGHTAKELGFAAPLFPIVPILGFVFCFITGISMAADPEMLAGFIGCLIFIALCYLSYYVFYRKQN